MTPMPDNLAVLRAEYEATGATINLSGSLYEEASLAQIELSAAVALIVALEARNRKLERWFDAINGDEITLLQSATVYDYHRHGIVAFQSDAISMTAFKALADERRSVTVVVFPLLAMADGAPADDAAEG